MSAHAARSPMPRALKDNQAQHAPKVHVVPMRNEAGDSPAPAQLHRAIIDVDALPLPPGSNAKVLPCVFPASFPAGGVGKRRRNPMIIHDKRVNFSCVYPADFEFFPAKLGLAGKVAQMVRR